MPPVFLATLGMRPAAITVALDVLHAKYHYELGGLLLTDPTQSDIAASYAELKPELRKAYPTITFKDHIICHKHGEPIVDIEDDASAEAYHRGVLAVLKHYRQQGHKVHLLVAGGRKAMSVYATLAAALVFRFEDIVWTVLSSPEIVDKGGFHIKPQQYKEVRVVRLPLLPARILTSRLPDMDIDELLHIQDDPRERFLNDLTPVERELVDMVAYHPHASYTKLGKLLGKEAKTIENQLNKIYVKMLPYFDLSDLHKKKNALVDVMTGRL